ncbi:MAG: deoxyribose-phosphate aldolase [Thermoleophilia bacterium]|nr:deoxyribose-phosphate aldolase [Thermoleophilia bacterium]MDH3724968.1 deoxyribose-phosphate aldolase [Thermoleophilia bacterium]
MATLAGAPGALTIERPDGQPVHVGPVDAFALETRAKRLASRSVKRESKRAGLLLATTCIDLTTLEGGDTPGKVRALCARATRPDPDDLTVPPVAAVCVYPALVAVAREALQGTSVRVASVAGSFPAGQASIDERLHEIRAAVADGADEIDIVLNRNALLAGRLEVVRDEVAASKEACGHAHLKTILETGELGSYEMIRRASFIAMAAGSDMIKTSTGKLPSAATPPVALCMAEAIRDFEQQTGEAVGLKLAGGIRRSKQALGYLAIIAETLGTRWLTPERFRLGASSLLNDIVLQLRFQTTGRYGRPGDLPVD